MNNWLYVLLLHLIRCPQTISRAKDKIKTEDLQEFFPEDEFVYLWTLSHQYYGEHGHPIPEMHLMSGLHTFITAQDLDDGRLDELSNFLAWAYSAEEADLNFSEAVKHIRKLLQHTRVNKRMQSLLTEPDVSPDQILEEVNIGTREATISNAVAINPMKLLRQKLGVSAPVPLGGNDVQYFNTLCQGGLMEGEVLVLIGPTGGFKSTMALDVQCSMAAVEQYSAFLGYEQSVNGGDLSHKFWTRLTGIPRDVWKEEDADTKVVDNPENNELLATADKHAEYVMWFDRTQNCDMVSDIAGLVQDMISNGKKPELIVIDQLLPWIENWPEYQKATEKRHIVQSAMLRLKREVAEKYQTRILLLHQLTAALNERGSNFKPSVADSAEIKGIGMWADFVIHIGKMCPDTKCLWGIATKTRRGQYTEIILRADGSRGRISKADDMEYDIHGGRKFVQSGQKNVVPDTNTKKLAKGSEDYGI